jgi:hypothetical protein
VISGKRYGARIVIERLSETEALESSCRYKEGGLLC